MDSAYKQAIQLYEQKEFEAARQLFEALILETLQEEDRAYLFLHLFRCLKYLGRDDLAHDAIARGRALAPQGSRYSLDAGIEEAVYLTEKGKYMAALATYKQLQNDFSDLLAKHQEEHRRRLIEKQISELRLLTRDII